MWFDADADGTLDVGEPGIPGVGVTVTWFGVDGVAGGGDDQVFTTSTNSTGTWTVTQLPAGAYTVVAERRDRGRQGSPCRPPIPTRPTTVRAR